MISTNLQKADVEASLSNVDFGINFSYRKYIYIYIYVCVCVLKW